MKRNFVLLFLLIFLGFILIQPIAANVRDTAQPPGKIFIHGDKSYRHFYSGTAPSWTSDTDTDNYRLKFAGATQNNGKSLIYREMKELKNRFLAIDEDSYVNKDGLTEQQITRYSGGATLTAYYECTIKLIKTKKNIKLIKVPGFKKKYIKIVYYLFTFKYVIQQAKDKKWDQIWESSRSVNGVQKSHNIFPEKGSEPGPISSLTGTKIRKDQDYDPIYNIKMVYFDLTKGHPDIASYYKFVKTKKRLDEDWNY